MKNEFKIAYRLVRLLFSGRVMYKDIKRSPLLWKAKVCRMKWLDETIINNDIETEIGRAA